MKKFAYLTSIFLLVSAVFAQPNFWGTRGLFRTVSADNQGRGFLSLSLYGHGYYANTERQLANDETEQMSTRMANGYLSASFAPFNFIELSGGTGMAYLYNIDIYHTANRHYAIGFGDSYAGLKLSVKPFWWVNIGGYGYAIFPTGGSALKETLITTQETAFGGMGLLTFDLINPKAQFPLPLRIHLNAGMHKGNRTDTTGAKDDYYDYLLLRGGLEIPAGSFDLFADFSTERSMSDKQKKGDAMRITPGVRFNASGASMNLGCEIGLGKRGVDYMSHGREFAPYEDDTMKIPWKLVFGFTFDTRLIKEQPVPIFADVSGSVIDADKKTPIVATVRLEGQPDTEPSVIATPDGHYSIRVGKGVHNIIFSANGYRTLSKAITVADSHGIALDVELEPLIAYGTVTGRVFDIATNQPLSGTIRLPGSNEKPIVADKTTGVFKAELPIGSYTLELEVPGYHKITEVVIIEKDKITQKDLGLRFIDTAVDGELKGVITDAKTGLGLNAKITILEGGVPPIYSSEGTGAYSMILPKGTYTLNVTKDGYIPTTQTVIIKVKETTVQNITLRPEPISTITGKVINTKDKMPLKATISFPGSDIPATSADENGIYTVKAKPGTVTVKAEFEGFVPQAFPVVVEQDKTAVQNFELIKKGEKITLTGIYFDFNKATIKPESRSTLDQAIKILTDNPTIRVRIEGHTDSIGSDSYNMNLSKQRADSVKAYLVKNGGIDASRIESVGKGETEPIASNETDEGRSVNRRIEFVVVGD